MKKFLAKDKTKNYSLSELNEVIKYSIEYCKGFLGINNRHKTDITYSIYTGDLTQNCYGFYCPHENEIIIMLQECKTIKDIVTLICHEYTHSLQPIKTKYTKLAKTYGYKNHPHEIEAESNEYLFKEILREYRKKLI